MFYSETINAYVKSGNNIAILCITHNIHVRNRFGGYLAVNLAFFIAIASRSECRGWRIYQFASDVFR